VKKEKNYSNLVMLNMIG